MTPWDLPGPRRFLADLTADLVLGKSVCCFVPDGGLTDVLSAVETRLAGQEVTRRFVRIHALTDVDVRPAAQLAAAFDLTSSMSTAADVASHRSLQGHVVAVNAPDAHCLKPWSAFLTRYQHVVRDRPVYERPAFLVLFQGRQLAAAPPADLCLCHHRFDNAVGWVDARLWIATLLSDDRNLVRQHMMASVIAELSGADLSLAHEMALWNLDELLAPADKLQHVAAVRGWTRENLQRMDTSERFWSGAQQTVDGRRRWHSAALSVLAPERLTALVWLGQVRELWPIVEHARCDVIECLADRFPADELALKQIHELHRMANSVGDPADRSAIKQRIELLRDVRNQLAHLEVVPRAAIEHGLEACLRPLADRFG